MRRVCRRLLRGFNRPRGMDRTAGRIGASLIVALVAVIVPPPSAAFAATVDWVTQFGTEGSDVAYDVAVDSAGNTYVAGETSGTFPGQVGLGSNDVFLVKYDPTGSLLWARQLGTPGYDQVHGLALDSVGNAYLAGDTDGTLPGQTNAGAIDAFLVKYSASGGQLWVHQFGAPGYDYASDVAVDASSTNVYIVGGKNPVAEPSSPEGFDGFLAKYNSSGSRLWLREVATPNADAPSGVAVGSSGDAYLAGATRGALAGQTSAGGWDAFVAKYGPSGIPLWVRQFGTPSDDSAGDVAVDSSGNAHIAGNTTAGTFPGQTRAGSVDAFVAKYDSSGSVLWVRQFGTRGGDHAIDVAVDFSGNTYAVGYTFGTFPGQMGAGESDAFVAKFDPSGSVLWVHQLGSTGLDIAFSVVADSTGTAYIAGDTHATLPGESSAGGRDAFVAKVGPTTGGVPAAGDDAYTHYGSDTALEVSAPGVLTNDTDPDGDSLVAVLVSGPGFGTLSLNPDGSFEYTPKEDFVGSDSFTYAARDGAGTSHPATVTITVGAGCAGKPATITGTGTADRLKGTPRADIIAGLGGDDTILGGGGDDAVCAGGGEDRVNAGSGADYVHGGSGDDNLHGHRGDDTLYGAGGADVLHGGADEDVLDGGAGDNDTCMGGGGTDRLLAQRQSCDKVRNIP